MPDRIQRQGDLTADRTLFVDAEGNVVEAGDPSRIKKLVHQNLILPKEDAETYGITEKGGILTYPGYVTGTPEETPATEGEPEGELPAETLEEETLKNEVGTAAGAKALKRPSQTKAVTPDRDK